MIQEAEPTVTSSVEGLVVAPNQNPWRDCEQWSGRFKKVGIPGLPPVSIGRIRAIGVPRRAWRLTIDVVTQMDDKVRIGRRRVQRNLRVGPSVLAVLRIVVAVFFQLDSTPGIAKKRRHAGDRGAA